MKLFSKQTLPSAAKALQLEHDGTFRLLFLMTAILGWVVALGCAGAVMMQNVYTSWQLEKAQTVNLYLPPDVTPEAVRKLEDVLSQTPGILRHQVTPPETIRATLSPYVSNPESLPLPVVIEAQTAKNTPPETIQQAAQAVLPGVEVDDPRPLLKAVSKGVHLMQGVGLGLAGLMGGLTLLLVVLTVRTGLNGQRATCHLLQQLGATNGFVATRVAAQVARQGAYGWAAASGTALLLVLAGTALWPTLAPFVGWKVWLTLTFAPSLLPGVEGITAYATALHQLQQTAHEDA